MRRDQRRGSHRAGRATGTVRRAFGGSRSARSRYAAAVGGLLLVAGCAQQVVGSGTVAADAHLPTPTATPTPTTPPLPGSDCAQGKVDTTATSPNSVILTASPDDLSVDKAQTQPTITLAQLIINPANTRIPNSRDFLESVGYVTGSAKAWSHGPTGTPGNRTEYVSLYQFENSAGACAFTKWETDNYKYTPNPDYTSIGMVGNHTPPGPGPVRIASYLASKGRFVVETAVVFYAPPGAPDNDIDAISRFAASLLNMQYQRL